MIRSSKFLISLVSFMVGCVSENDEMVLGPVDGFDLSGLDLERVQAGHLAPDFTLSALNQPPITLSEFRGSKNVVLVFYRGKW
ncbi:MAG: hypothetical protein CME29_04100 [Gemmatimonadetes bacterium]|nr:hypothetical protein [Gemmatimonadota bacterium]|tara:strand:- start:84532 stop:84780 length:249 start_codon:yes stop_codon:yes gene_type:complete